MMTRAIVGTAMVVMTLIVMMIADVRRIGVAHNNFQSSIDWSEHEACGN
jgi:hypothetical protein